MASFSTMKHPIFCYLSIATGILSVFKNSFFVAAFVVTPYTNDVEISVSHFTDPTGEVPMEADIEMDTNMDPKLIHWIIGLKDDTYGVDNKSYAYNISRSLSEAIEVDDSKINKMDIFQRTLHKFYEPTDFQQVGTPRIPYWPTSLYPKKVIHHEAESNTVSHANIADEISLSFGPCYPPTDLSEMENWKPLNPQVLKDRFEKSSAIKPLEYTSGTARKDSEENSKTAKHCSNSTTTFDIENDDVLEDERLQQIEAENNAGMCRPGFLIVGAGKSGSSSLYQYILQHPRVAPARQKQIGFFKYFKDRGLKCYMSYFPSAEEFISSGSMITGEAFPGYLPYPNVPPSVASLLGSRFQDKAEGHGPKIIVTVREPLSRAYSSYKYNYVRMALNQIHTENENNGGDMVERTDEYYIKNNLLTFEEMISAELEHLKECLVPGGKAETLSLKMYGDRVRERRNLINISNSTNDSLFPLIDVEQCYVDMNENNDDIPHSGDHLSKLKKKYPNKIVDIPQTNHLIRSMVARGLYILSVDWWYETFPSDDIHIVCLEQLSKSTKSLDDLTSFLGLPPYDYSNTLEKGRFNVAGNEGFNSLTRPDEIIVKPSSKIPISDEVKYQFQQFVSVYNERLFKQIGKRCSWQ